MNPLNQRPEGKRLHRSELAVVRLGSVSVRDGYDTTSPSPDAKGPKRAQATKMKLEKKNHPQKTIFLAHLTIAIEPVFQCAPGIRQFS
jgi:hypothetical protein